jgi:hypothetical protein
MWSHLHKADRQRDWYHSSEVPSNRTNQTSQNAATNLRHSIELQNTSILNTKLERWQIKLPPDNIDREDGFYLSHENPCLLPEGILEAFLIGFFWWCVLSMLFYLPVHTEAWIMHFLATHTPSPWHLLQQLILSPPFIFSAAYYSCYIYATSQHLYLHLALNWSFFRVQTRYHFLCSHWFWVFYNQWSLFH